MGERGERMVTAADFEIEGIQVSAWASSGQLQPSRLYRFILQNQSDRYDGEPEFLPAEAIPAEVPALVIISTNQEWRMEVARSRVNLFWRRTEIKTTQVGAALQSLSEDLAGLFGVEGVPVGRLAVVVSRAASSETPAANVASQYFREQWLKAPFNRLKAMEIHSLKTFALTDKLDVNSWVRIRTGERIGANPGPVIAVEQDINTKEEEREERTFNVEDIMQFFDLAGKELDHILELYFPSNTEHTERLN
jgi:ribosomal protein L39E